MDTKAILDADGVMGSAQWRWAELTGDAPAEFVLSSWSPTGEGRVSVYDVSDASAPRRMGEPAALGSEPMVADLDGDGVSELLLTQPRGGGSTLHIYRVMGGGLVEQGRYETRGHVHVPFDHDNDGRFEVVVLTTSNPEDLHDPAATIGASLMDARTGKDAATVGIEVWLPRFHTYALVSEDLPLGALVVRWSTRMMEAMELTPFEPDRARDAAVAAMARRPRSFIEIPDPEAYALALYWLPPEELRGLMKGGGGPESTGPHLGLLRVYAKPERAQARREVALEVLRGVVTRPEVELGQDLFAALGPGDRAAVCAEVGERLSRGDLSDRDRGVLVARGVRQVGCVGLALGVLEDPERYTPEDIKLALNTFNPKLHIAPLGSPEQEARGTRAAIALLTHDMPDVRASAALVVMWREGGEEPLATALEREEDIDTRAMFQAALDRKRTP